LESEAFFDVSKSKDILEDLEISINTVKTQKLRATLYLKKS